MPGDVDAVTEAFDQFGRQMDMVAGAFDSKLGETALHSASPAAAGSMTESAAFMQHERQARESLAQFMTQSSQGLHGYVGAVTAIGAEYNNLIELNNSRLTALLQENDGPVATSEQFNWQDVLARQAAARPAGG